MSEILKIANNILHLLDYSQKLTDEEILFSDEFYISILTNLLTEQNKELIPGQTPEQKVKSLKNLIRTLSDIIEIDLSQINAEGIIMNHDKESAKSLLELIEELIKTLINSNTIEAKEENNNKKNEEEENEYESEELINENDINSVNIKKLRERMKLSDDIDNEENENSSYKRKYAELEDGIDNLNDNFEEEEKENENKSMNINYNSEDKNNESGSRVMNVSHISEMEKNKIQELSSSKEKNKKNKKIKDIIELEENNPSSKKSNTKTNKKKYEEIPNLLINKIKKDTDNNNNIEKENDEESIKYNNYLESNSNMGESNLYGEENYNVPQSVPRAYNKLHLSNDSNESENSNNHYIRSKKKLNKKKEKENQSSNNTNSNINNEKNITDEYNEEINISSTNKKNKEVTLNSKKISENNEKNIQKSSASKISKNKNKKISYENINYIEIPMSNEEMKYLIKKELRKLYGEKASQYFKKDFLELISENLKETRKAIIKYETGKEADDFFSREFFQKYLKEMQKIIKNCINELNKENVYKKNVIMNLGNNIKIVKKLKDAENKEISNDIENKKNDFNSRNDEINMNNLNQILMYPKYCYELQKKIHLLQIQNQIEFNYALEQERENKLEETKKNYEEHISTLNKILKQRKKERLNKKKFGELLESSLKEMKKSKLRKQVEDMLDQIDEDDEKINVEDNNEQIEKIMKNII